jgi:glycosyltransferase involved in cell wall biosynthesis
MKLGVDLTNFNTGYAGGVGRYSKEITKALISLAPSSVIVLCSESNFEDLRRMLGNQAHLRVFKTDLNRFLKLLYSFTYRIHPNEQLYKYVQLVQFRKVNQYCSKNIDFLYVPTTYLNFIPKKSKTIVSLHDCQEKSFPHFFSKDTLNYREINSRISLKYANYIQTSSKFVRDELIKYYEPIIGANFRVIPEGCKIDVTAAKTYEDKSDPFQILIPASFHHHKNQEFILRAVTENEFPRKLRIVLTGSTNVLSETIARKYKGNEAIEIVFAGLVSDEQLSELYRTSDLVISSSMYESSSLPILEAMSFGIPVAASDIPAHREMAEDFEIELFSLDHTHDFVRILSQMMESNKESLNRVISRNLKSIESRDWKKIAELYLDITQEVD